MVYITTTVTARGSPHLSAKNLGTGNVLFQIASIYGLAKTLGRTAEFSSVLEYCDHIRRLYGYTHRDTIYRSLPVVPVLYAKCMYELRSKTVDTALVNALQTSSESLQVHGYLESPLYFHAYRNEIIDLFSPDDASASHIRTHYPELETETCVALHIRAGPDANTRCSLDYYKLAIAYIESQVANPLYIICSDGDVDPHDIGVTRYRKIRGEPDYMDLWIMSKCSHAITSYSTFSWWAGYLNRNPNKIVTYPRSALLYIRSCQGNGETEDAIHRDYFLGAVQIKDA